MRVSIRLFLAIALTGFVVEPGFGQAQVRRMLIENLCYESAEESKDEDSDCLVELLDVQIDGQKITSGKPFVADENWLKNLKIRVRNVSGKSFVFVGVGFGLIEGLYEKLAPEASWGWAFAFGRGRPSNPPGKGYKISDVVVLKPNEEVELSYSDLPELHKQSLSKVVGGMSQIVFIRASVEFENGKQEDSYLFIRGEQK